VELPWLLEVPVVRVLRQVWTEQYIDDAGTLRWREVKEIPTPADMISSPHDAEVRYSSKRSVEWVGYKVHLVSSGMLKCLILDLWLQHQLTRLNLTPRALSTELTRRAIQTRAIPTRAHDRGLRFGAVLGAALVVYDFVATSLLPLMNDL